jgi:hypothetical protein
MQDHIQNYTDRGIYTFTFEGLTAEINDKGKDVKKAHGFPTWKSINRNNFTEYLYYHHRGLAVMTGKMSNITGFDFDNKEEYDKMIELHPELKNNYTVQSNKGYHIYFKYNETIKTTTNAMNSFAGVDIRNDDGILYAPPTIYKIKNTDTIVEYKFLGGEILDCPDYLINDLKQNHQTPTATATPQIETTALTTTKILVIKKKS